MPTTRARHLITETDEVAAALDAAAARWPDLTRPQLVVKLLLTAAAPLGAEDRLARARAAMDRIDAGEFAGLYPPGYLAELREDWSD